MKRLRPYLFLAVFVLAFGPVAALASTPMLGVPTDVRRGFYTETDFGAFFTVGGEGASPSNAQVYLSLGLGYDVYAQGKSFVSVGLGFSLGTSAGACFGTYIDDTNGAKCVDPALGFEAGNDGLLSDHWTATTVEAHVLYGYEFAPRLMLTARALGGAGFIEPMAFANTDNPVPLVGGGVGLEYATRFEHFSLGLDLAGKYFLGPNVLGFAVAPRVKYTF